MCWWVPLISMAATAMSAQQQSHAVDMDARARTEAANMNSAELERQALRSEEQARDAWGRGERERENYMRDFGQEQGQRAAQMGASGIALDSGSFQDVLASSAMGAASDAATIRANAGREGEGYLEAARGSRLEAMNARNEARYVQARAKLKKKAMVLSALGSLAGKAISKGFSKR